MTDRATLAYRPKLLMGAVGKQIILRDVTLREHGQNVPAPGIDRFGVYKRIELALRLVDCGARVLEVASTASPKVVPAMAPELLRPFLHGLGRPDGVELVTLVPSARGAERFLDLGLGPDGLGHTMGVFVSAVEEHSDANTGRSIAETLAELEAFLPAAALMGVPVAGYVSGAFGFRPREDAAPFPARFDQVVELALRLVDLGAKSVTVSDLQGLADATTTGERIARLVEELARSGVPVGYHGHNPATEPAVANVVAAVQAGATIIDASLGATGGCIVGAPGNAPIEVVAARLEALGVTTGYDVDALAALAADSAPELREALRP